MGGRARIATLAAVAAALVVAVPAAGQLPGETLLDLTPPATPAPTPTPASPNSEPSPTWSFSTDEPATFECVLQAADAPDPDATTTGTSCESGYYAPTLPGEGDYELWVRATDTAGNPSSWGSGKYTLDTTGPLAPVIAGDDARTGNERTVSWSFTREEGAGEECRLDPPESTGAWASCESTKSYPLSETDPDGVYTFNVRSVDALGNPGPADTATYELDTVVPATPALTSPPSTSSDRTPTWTFTTEDGATYDCTLAPAFTTPEPCPSGTSTFDLAGADDGDYTFVVTARDAAGNTSESTTTYRLDTTPPAAPTITDGPPERITEPAASFSFTAEGRTECRLDRGGATVYDWTACSSPFAYGLTTQPDGSYEFLVRGTDAAGNTGPAASRSFTLERPPPVVDAPPAAGEPALRAGVCINLFSGSAAAETMTGSPLGDVLLGDAGDDRLRGLAGDDCLMGDAGNDRLFGGAGNDDVRGLAGNDTLSGGKDDDRLDGGGGSDRMSGSPGDDRAVGRGGNDKFAGGSGDDRLSGGGGKDRLSGGKGKDKFSAGGGNDTINARDGRREKVDCGAGRDRVKADRRDRLTGCERRSRR